MKNSLKYFLLWQKKRSELPVQDDPQADWNHMQSLLDEHMPVKKSGGFKGFRTLPALFITFSAAAMVYLAGNIYSLEKHNHAVKHHLNKSNTTQPAQAFADTSNVSGAKAGKGNDSLPSGSQNVIGSDSIGADGKRIANSQALIASASDSKNNGLSKANKPGRGAAGLNGRTNPAAIVVQNSNRTQNVVRNNKTVRGTGVSSTHGVHSATPGGGNGNLAGAAGENKTGGNTTGGNKTDQYAAAANAFSNRHVDGTLIPTTQPLLKVDLNLNKIQPAALPGLISAVNKMHGSAANQTKGNKKGKPGKSQNSRPSNLDWGILIGLNTSGSFTPKSQNANFYGSAPVDPYFGLFATFKINSNWAINPQMRFFSPQNIVTTYTHANQSKVDSGQSLTITASRKMYAVSVPIYAVYNAGNGLAFKAGPVINFPVKQINSGTVLLPYSIRTDTSYYKNVSTILNATQYRQSINFGFSAGASYQFKRFIFEATYLKSLSGYRVTDSLGSYKSYNGTLQFTIGFQLDKVKP